MSGPGATYIGVDPGTTGAIALIHAGRASVWDIPVRRVKKGRAKLDHVELRAIARALSSFDPVCAVLEDVWAAGGDFAASVGPLLYISGAVEQALVSEGVRCIRVPSATWKARLRLSGGVPYDTHKGKKRAILKSRSVEMASRVFEEDAPLFRGKRGGILPDRAEAVLLAWYGATLGQPAIE